MSSSLAYILYWCQDRISQDSRKEMPVRGMEREGAQGGKTSWGGEGGSSSEESQIPPQQHSTKVTSAKLKQNLWASHSPEKPPNLQKQDCVNSPMALCHPPWKPTGSRDSELWGFQSVTLAPSCRTPGDGCSHPPSLQSRRRWLLHVFWLLLFWDRLASNLLCSQRWPWPVSTSQVLGLQVCATHAWPYVLRSKSRFVHAK